MAGLYDVDDVARVCHEANRALQLVHQAPGIPVAAPWDLFPENERRGVRAGVEHARAGATPEELHESWCAQKRADGWTYGPVKDAEAKTHPCLVPYADLPAAQRVKDALFGAIVATLVDELPERTR